MSKGTTCEAYSEDGDSRRGAIASILFNSVKDMGVFCPVKHDTLSLYALGWKKGGSDVWGVDLRVYPCKAKDIMNQDNKLSWAYCAIYKWRCAEDYLKPTKGFEDFVPVIPSPIARKIYTSLRGNSKLDTLFTYVSGTTSDDEFKPVEHVSKGLLKKEDGMAILTHYAEEEALAGKRKTEKEEGAFKVYRKKKTE